MSWEYLSQVAPAILSGVPVATGLFFVTILVSIPLGMLITLLATCRLKPLQWLAKAYIYVIRGTPLLLQLMFIYFGLPLLPVVGEYLITERFPATIIGFVLNYAAYFAEIYRAGIQSIDRGQHEAAKTLGFTRWQTMRLIILPQTVSRVIPPVCNETITLVKDTALVTAIGVGELLKAAEGAVNRDMDITAYILVALIYLALTFVLTVVYERLEKRFSRHQKKEG